MSVGCVLQGSWFRCVYGMIDRGIIAIQEDEDRLVAWEMQLSLYFFEKISTGELTLLLVSGD